jgi:hypothetical protein
MKCKKKEERKMTEISVKELEKSKKSIDAGVINCASISIEDGLNVTSEAIEWLKENHYQIKIVETLGKTGIAAYIYPANAE